MSSQATGLAPDAPASRSSRPGAALLRFVLVLGAFVIYALTEGVSYESKAVVVLEQGSRELDARPLELALRFHGELVERLKETSPEQPAAPLDRDDLNELVRVRSSDGRTFTVSVRAASASGAQAWTDRAANILATRAPEMVGLLSARPLASAARGLARFVGAHEAELVAPQPPPSASTRRLPDTARLTAERARITAAIATAAPQATGDNPFSDQQSITTLRRRLIEIDQTLASANRAEAPPPPPTRRISPAVLPALRTEVGAVTDELTRKAAPLSARVTANALLPSSPIESRRISLLLVGFALAVVAALLPLATSAFGGRTRSAPPPPLGDSEPPATPRLPALKPLASYLPEPLPHPFGPAVQPAMDGPPPPLRPSSSPSLEVARPTSSAPPGPPRPTSSAPPGPPRPTSSAPPGPPRPTSSAPPGPPRPTSSAPPGASPSTSSAPPAPGALMAFSIPWQARGSVAPGPFGSIETQLRSLSEDACFVVAVTSHAVGAGDKARAAARLALTLAQDDQRRILLVDADLGHPQVASLLRVDVPEDVDFSAQLKARVDGPSAGAWYVLQCSPPFHLLPAVLELPELVLSVHFENCLHTLREFYDVIVVHAPTTTELGPCRAVDDVADGVLLVDSRGDAAFLSGDFPFSPKRLTAVLAVSA